MTQRTSRSDHWICAERSAHYSSRFRASLRKTERSANSELMSHAAHHDPAILQGARRVRYLKLIALFKIFEDVLLLLISVSLRFRNAWTGWMGALWSWTGRRILLEQSRACMYLLHK